jgi:hypothetical protein
MPGLKKHYPDFTYSANKVTQDEIDSYVETVYVYPTASATWFGTAAAITGSTSGTFVMTNQAADYPRTPLVTLTCAASTITVGTVSLTGTDQFGNAITEDISLSGTSGVTRAGTKIFKTITAGAITTGNTGGQGTALATITLGVAIGTATGQVARFGLGYKIGVAADVKMVTWINNGTATAITSGTVVSTLVSAATHSFAGTKIVAATDIYKVQSLPTYNGANDPANVCS